MPCGRVRSGRNPNACGRLAPTRQKAIGLTVPFVGLFGKKAALGEDFHITSDNAYPWDKIYTTIAAGLGVDPDIVHVPTDTLVRYHPDWEGPLRVDKTWATLFDNTKVKRVVGDFAAARDLSEALVEPIANFWSRLEAKRAKNSELEPLVDRIASEQRSLGG